MAKKAPQPDKTRKDQPVSFFLPQEDPHAHPRHGGKTVRVHGSGRLLLEFTDETGRRRRRVVLRDLVVEAP